MLANSQFQPVCAKITKGELSCNVGTTLALKSVLFNISNTSGHIFLNPGSDFVV